MNTHPDLWKHQTTPIQLCLVVDEFGVKYVGKRMPSIWDRSQNDIMSSQHIGVEQNTSDSPFSGIIQNIKSISLCQGTSRKP